MERVTERIRMTYNDLLALPDDGLRHELIDGSTSCRLRPDLPTSSLLGICMC